MSRNDRPDPSPRQADLKADGGEGEPPVGLAAPNTAVGGGGGRGVERMGEGVLQQVDGEGASVDVEGVSQGGEAAAAEDEARLVLVEVGAWGEEGRCVELVGVL